MADFTYDLNPLELIGIKLKLASPDTIRKKWSKGEVVRATTINYRTQEPEPGGLFCQRIFGPVKDYECACGKYKGRKYRGIICDVCGVEVTSSVVRRRRMGHIKLVIPVAHIWFYKVPPSIIGVLLDLTIKELEDILYYNAYIVLDPGEVDEIKKGQYLSIDEYNDLVAKYGENAFRAEMGAAPIKELLKEVGDNLEKIEAELRTKIFEERSEALKHKFLRKWKIIDALIFSKTRPEWMILEYIPVIPPDLRPIVPLEGGKYATADLNDLYRRVINRNNRLKYMMEYGAPDIVLRNEKRLLQEAVDALLDNSRRDRPIMTKNNRAYKSLSDILRGKKGRLRRNLLGKRVDYSGRSVIVVDSELKLHQVGIPKEMAVELFRPFVERKLVEKGLAETTGSAKRIFKKKPDIVWEVLEEIVKDYPVLLNRAPTLHRVSIEAFIPVLKEDKAIHLHPLVCPPFNADFDGDQMGVFVPILPEAKAEAKYLMMPYHNILSPAHGEPLISPTHDMVAGLNYLTKEKKGAKGENKEFATVEEVLNAVENDEIDVRCKIKLRFKDKIIETTPGRVIFNLTHNFRLGFVNKELDKKSISRLVKEHFYKFGEKLTAEFLDNLKELGFKYATYAGLTFGMDDLIIPSRKNEIIDKAWQECKRIEEAFRKGEISYVERYYKLLDVWTRATEEITALLQEEMAKDKDGFNPIWLIVNSGARGNIDQLRQLSGIRGLMTRPTRGRGFGDYIETPVISSFKEGLSVMEYFVSTHGARKGLSDTALKTADAGYLTRRLVDVAQEVIVTIDDCETPFGRKVRPLLDENGQIIESLADRIKGRIAAEDVVHPSSGEVIVKEGEMITEEKAKEIEEAGVEEVEIRSVLKCKAKEGVCAKCYGLNLATGRLVEKGEPVGVVAAQSIGEPGTQLTLRTFHTGGVAERELVQSYIEAPFDGKVEYKEINFVDKKGKRIVLSKKGKIKFIPPQGKTIVFDVPYGSELYVKDGETVRKGQIVCEWDPYSYLMLAHKKGRVHFIDLVENITYKESREGGRLERIVFTDRYKRYFPKMQILDPKTGAVLDERYLVNNTHLVVKEGDLVDIGDIIARVPKGGERTRDITFGLPRVEELFEARSPKNKAILSEIDGKVIFEDFNEKKGVHIIKIVSESGEERVYEIPYGRYLLVENGESVSAGDPLCSGEIDPHDLLKIKGKDFVQDYLLDEIQKIYRLSGVKINDKHIEIIIRQMLMKVVIRNPGQTRFVEGEVVDIRRVEEENSIVLSKGGEPAEYEPILLGITRAALTTDSFIAAASFRDTTKVLIEAALRGKEDRLKGLKENVIIGGIIPAGTGFRAFQKVEVKKHEEAEEKKEERKEAE